MSALPGASAWHDGLGPLAGVRVLVARPAGRADDLVAALRAAGASPVAVPLIATTPMTESPALRAAVADLASGGFDWVAFTSAATVGALAATAHATGAEFRVATRTRVAAVGPATAAALLTAGVPVHLRPDGPGSADALAAAWPTDPARSAVLVPCSDRAAPTLPDALRAAGHRVTVVAAYRTEILPVPNDLARQLASGTVDAALLTSPSTAHALATVPLAPGIRLVAIGEPTARAAGADGLPVAAVAAEPSARGLVDALVHAMHEPQRRDGGRS